MSASYHIDARELYLLFFFLFERPHTAIFVVVNISETKKRENDS